MRKIFRESNLISKLRIEALIIGFTWMMLWLLPWSKLMTPGGSIYLIFIIDMIRLLIVLFMCILPGILLFLLLIGNDAEMEYSTIIPAGFTFAVSIIAVIGLTAKIVGASFEFVKVCYASFGGIELMLIKLYRPEISLRLLKEELPNGFRGLINNSALLAALSLATMMTFHDYLFFIDDLSYLAILTNWQHSTRLGFTNIVQAVGTMENPRFWLALFPMGQAILSEVSGIPGILLLGNYLELYLVPMAVLASYSLARALGLSRKQAGFSVLIQVSFYIWMNSGLWPVGRWFYQSMAEDKVAATFILSPILFGLVIRYLRSSTTRKLFMILICGIGLTLTHPIILFYSCIVVLGITIIYWINQRASLKKITPMVFVLIISLSPYALIRFSDIPAQKGLTFDAESASATYEAERYIDIASNTFYGLNIELLKLIDLPVDTRVYIAYQYFRLIPVLIICCSVLLAAAKFRGTEFHWLILACGLLVIFTAIPYTGWLLGYFISSRMLARASWYMPLGLGSVLLLTEVRNWLVSHYPIYEMGKFKLLIRLNLYLTLVGVLCCVSFTGPLILSSLVYRLPRYFEILDQNRQMAQIGAYIDGHTNGWSTNISLKYWPTQLLPGVSANTELISYREETERNGFNSSFSINEIHERIYASNLIISTDDSVSAEERCYY